MEGWCDSWFVKGPQGPEFGTDHHTRGDGPPRPSSTPTLLFDVLRYLLTPDSTSIPPSMTSVAGRYRPPLPSPPSSVLSGPPLQPDRVYRRPPGPRDGPLQTSGTPYPRDQGGRQPSQRCGCPELNRKGSTRLRRTQSRPSVVTGTSESPPTPHPSCTESSRSTWVRDVPYPVQGKTSRPGGVPHRRGPSKGTRVRGRVGTGREGVSVLDRLPVVTFDPPSPVCRGRRKGPLGSGGWDETLLERYGETLGVPRRVRTG